MKAALDAPQQCADHHSGARPRRKRAYKTRKRRPGSAAGGVLAIAEQRERITQADH
jgi:hypothetical protein